jgi:thiamine biosynthesis lipoprotein
VREERRTFECFGGLVAVAVLGPASMGPGDAVAQAELELLAAHRRLSRFLPDSELSLLNRDRRTVVPADPLLLDLAAAAREAGELSAGLVDATLLSEIEAAGYADSMPGRPAPASPPEPGATRAARACGARAWREISVDRAAGTISRPCGVEIDSGGIAKGLLADRVGAKLARFPAYVVDCCGDIRVGGAAARPRPVRVEDPRGGDPLPTALRIADAGIATSGITRRAWRGPDGVAAHHVLDPSSGRPAFTGVIQATALAPTAFLADVHAKWALLSGPDLAPARLPYGGLLVLADGAVERVQARRPAEAAA